MSVMEDRRRDEQGIIAAELDEIKNLDQAPSQLNTRGLQHGNR
jgi:hypothetical protein